MFPTFVTILLLTIPANYRLSSQFLSVGLKVGVRVWFKVSVRSSGKEEEGAYIF
jgi:hypothetical protein